MKCAHLTQGLMTIKAHLENDSVEYLVRCVLLCACLFTLINSHALQVSLQCSTWVHCQERRAVSLLLAMIHQAEVVICSLASVGHAYVIPTCVGEERLIGRLLQNIGCREVCGTLRLTVSGRLLSGGVVMGHPRFDGTARIVVCNLVRASWCRA